MQVNDLLRRAALVAGCVAVAAFGVVYLLNDWFHHTFAPAVGLGNPAADAFGTALIVVISYFAQRAVSMAFFKDMFFGIAIEQKQVFTKVTDVETVG